MTAVRYRFSAWHLTEIYGHIYRLGNSIYLTLPNQISSIWKSDTKCTNERGALGLKCTTSSLDPPLNELCYRLIWGRTAWPGHVPPLSFCRRV
ncbi:hypothetical protein T07_12560 [Trichinella nelsoni]|uniref:Uncharacterized protein n=1 Tax=Trichinella nelsoni TaxID=6336 RepID=A0A0V0RH97_9BILA|nr:hypothetical protein T07_12560 [Trichinella nelsoni]